MPKSTSCYWTRIVVVALALVITAVPGILAAQGAAEVYAQQCAACHGASGKGDGPDGEYMTPAPGPFSTGLKGKSDSWIGTVIIKGGPAVGMSAGMPAHPTLSSTQIKALVQYVKGLKS